MLLEQKIIGYKEKIESTGGWGEKSILFQATSILF